LRRVRPSLPVLGICLLVAGAVALGVWWWTLRSATDPIDADPVDAYAVVVSSPACPGGADTTVTLTVQGAPVTATISGCGHAKDQRIAVQYLAGHPEQMRQAGTTTAGDSGLAGKLLPIGILAAGLVAVLATVALLVERRRSRHLAAGGSLSVAEIRARSARGGSADGGDGVEATGTVAPAAVRTDADSDAGPGAGPEMHDGTQRGDDADEAPRDRDEAPVTESDPGHARHRHADPGDEDPGIEDTGADTAEPAHVLPSGFVLVEEQLFTHSGTEAQPGEDRPG
jgi:hypothetical protein